MANVEREPFPKDPSEFQYDDRISFAKLDNKWILEDHDGSEWEYSESLGKWVPSLDQAMIEQQQKAYQVAGVDDTEDAATQHRKRKQAYKEEAGANAKRQKQSEDKPKPERKNTAVYVTNLPLDATVDEINDVFSRCGVIAEEIDSSSPRIKIYTDDQGNPKGDAFIMFFRPESVQLAISLLDDTDFRMGERNPAGTMRVKEADFSYKKNKDAPVKQFFDKNKVIKKAQKMNSKLTDWSDDEDSPAEKINPKFRKVVYLKHMFTLKELAEDPAAILDIKEDIRDECEKLGQVTNITLFDKEDSGVASVRFATDEAAQACVQLMDGRHFAGQKIEAWVSRGDERFRKSDDKKGRMDEKDEEQEEAERIKEFGQWLEKE